MNSAVAARATKEIRKDMIKSDRQFWTPEDVQALLTHLSRRIDERLDDDGMDPGAIPIPNRALISLLTSTGVRGAEICRDADND